MAVATSRVATTANVVEMAETLSRKLRKSGYYPDVAEITSPSSATVITGGETCVNFASNSFLGLCDHPKIIEAMIAALQQSGTGAGSARLIVSHEIHRELERRIAAFKGREDAVIFSSGMLVNLGLVPALASTFLRPLAANLVEDGILDEETMGAFGSTSLFVDRFSHGCIHDGAALSIRNFWGGTPARVHFFEHMDMADLEDGLSSDTRGHKVIITDGVFSIHGRIAPLQEIVRLARRYNAVVYVDDAHGTGVLGPTGRGTAELLGCDESIDIPVGTFSKALGGEGGFVVGTRDFCDFVRVAARTAVLQTGTPPANAAGLIAAINIAEAEPDRRIRLLENAHVVRSELERLGFSTCDSHHHIVPVFIGKETIAMAVYRELLNLGVFTGCARLPASPKGEAIIRCNMMATHTHEQLERLVDALEASGRRHGII